MRRDNEKIRKTFVVKRQIYFETFAYECIVNFARISRIQ